MEENLLTPEEVAKRLKVSSKSIREWLRTDKLKGVKIGRLWRVREDELKLLLSEVENREDRISARGYLADVPGSSEDFMREKHEENDEEERRMEWRYMTREERIQRIQSVQAKYADLEISTEKFIRHKQEDIDREEQARQERRSA